MRKCSERQNKKLQQLFNVRIKRLNLCKKPFIEIKAALQVKMLEAPRRIRNILHNLVGSGQEPRNKKEALK